MENIVFYFELHQPFRLKPLKVQDKINSKDIFWEEKNMEIFKRISENAYIPATKTLMENGIRSTFSLSGTFMEQAMKYNPKTLDVIDDYVKSGLCELMGETYYHSLASVWNEDEFEYQVKKQVNLLKTLFNYTPVSFRNTELIYNNRIAEMAKNMGFRNIIGEGTDEIIRNYNPNYRYTAPSGINLYLRNYYMSDNISFRFSNTAWKEYPLTADKYLEWIKKSHGDIMNLYMDYETFGEHQRKETGIFEFLKYLAKYMRDSGINTLNIREVENRIPSMGTVSIDKTISWADTRRDLSAWLGNEMQNDAFNRLKQCINTDNKDIWRYLQTSDLIYYMSMGNPQDFTVHEYFNPYRSPYLAFIYYMYALDKICEKSRMGE
ncbi:glycoside hydrolase family 57 protein [Ferroplasma sp.]|uniref:glycoside hydrolase family 57 protein n=1 Tax=Ferroplasma sp. TaxID=2591003 RepID=UPI00307E03E7